ncbi:MAG: aldo/keto reductase [Salinivirgaceae bacterium]|jgi:predicted aldo/keto reductase-like oxidoreductase|nr:aldo/keto reductase [Salinivirgaceae bacterium]
MIIKKEFGNTGHNSTRTIFGAFALSEANQKKADEIMDTVMESGINHIDTAASYGNSETRLGPWIKKYRNKFFLATKTEKRSYKEAKEELNRSLELLNTNVVDLWQMHNLVNMEQWQQAFATGGAIEAFIEAKEQGLVKYLGVTGHGLAAPKMHLMSIKKFDFDAVLLPYNYILMQNQEYSADFNKLLNVCNERSIAVQTIKSLAIGKLDNQKAQHNVWYNPLNSQDSINKAVNWVLANPDVFLNTSGDFELLKMIIKATKNLREKPNNKIMDKLVVQNNMKPLFTGNEI